MEYFKAQAAAAAAKAVKEELDRRQREAVKLQKIMQKELEHRQREAATEERDTTEVSQTFVTWAKEIVQENGPRLRLHNIMQKVLDRRQREVAKAQRVLQLAQVKKKKTRIYSLSDLSVKQKNAIKEAIDMKLPTKKEQKKNKNANKHSQYISSKKNKSSRVTSLSDLSIQQNKDIQTAIRMKFETKKAILPGLKKTKLQKINHELRMRIETMKKKYDL